MKTLVIEDDLALIELLRLTFDIAWPDLEIDYSQLGSEGVELSGKNDYDFILLDLGLPDMNGMDVITDIRKFSDTPIIVLTVKKEELDVIQALNKGADEYVFKPFRQMELISRIKNVLKRLHPSQGQEYTLGKISYYPTLNKLANISGELRLTPTENIFLFQLINPRNGIASYRSISVAIWGEEYSGCKKAIRVIVHQLNNKIYNKFDIANMIVNKSSQGYYLTTSH